MSSLNWGMISDGGVFESLMHAILYAKDRTTILFGRPGKDAGQDARSGDGTIIYQAKYRQNLNMNGAIDLALEELKKIRKYRQKSHVNYSHWKKSNEWVLVANFSLNPNDKTKWDENVVPKFHKEHLEARYWSIETLKNELDEHPEIRDVFFGSENRVLVGLKEAHDILMAECVGNMSLDKEIVGREIELETIINSFTASEDKFVLPVIGPGGIGKSRLLYEALVSLAKNDWRFFWALPETMSRSSSWFRLLNGNQQTCVVIDGHDAPGLLRTVIEQLSTVERRNWRVIFSCRTEKAEMLRRFQNDTRVHEPILLSPLDENQSVQLLNTCLDDKVKGEQPWLHSVYKFTKGVPGWLCLIADLVRKNKWVEIHQNADNIASLYVNSCLEEIDNGERVSAQIILRWLSLWGILKVYSGNQEQPEFLFIEEVKK